MDLIDRQAAMIAVTAGSISTATVFGRTEEGMTAAKEIIRAIKSIPSAQPEIIRCKDCKFWQDQEEGVVEVPICARPQNKFERHPFAMIIGGDGFCSYAERRTE